MPGASKVCGALTLNPPNGTGESTPVTGSLPSPEGDARGDAVRAAGSPVTVASGAATSWPVFTAESSRAVTRELVVSRRLLVGEQLELGER